jgi:demethylspheroidene O-methyltransferase
VAAELLPRSLLTAAVERCLHWRDDMLARPAFHRWAAAFPLTRWIVRRRTRELFDITAGFVYSQVLSACVRLDLFAHLAAAPATTAELAARFDIPEAGLLHLLRAAEELRLLRRCADDRWALGDLGAASRGSPGIAAMVAHHDMLYRDLADPLALLRDRRGASLADYWAYAGGATPAESARTDPYSELMASSQSFIADDVLAAFSLAGVQRLLDVGGGSGVFAQAALQRWPQLQATVFDLPPVAERAAERLRSAGLATRADARGGDMFHDELPRGAQVISLVRILHDHDDEAVMTLLRAVRRALDANGRLLIAEPLAGTPAAGGVGAYFELYLWAMGSGRPRRAAELRHMLAAAGFTDFREFRTRRPLLVRVLTARPLPDSKESAPKM